MQHNDVKRHGQCATVVHDMMRINKCMFVKYRQQYLPVNYSSRQSQSPVNTHQQFSYGKFEALDFSGCSPVQNKKLASQVRLINDGTSARIHDQLEHSLYARSVRRRNDKI